MRWSAACAESVFDCRALERVQQAMGASVVKSRDQVRVATGSEAGVCRNLLSIDSRLNRIVPSTNIFPPNPERGYRTIQVTN